MAMSTLLVSAPGVGAQSNELASAINEERKLDQANGAIAPIGAFAAIGDMDRLAAALNQGLSAGLNIEQCKEILVQIYAYAGFPRSLNALGQLMKVLEERHGRGIHDDPGQAPSALPPVTAMLEEGTKNQTRLVGSPVKGPLFDFAPAIDQYLKSHLFGDIFARDNLDWQSRELATVGALSALTGVEAQLQSHLKVSFNVGLSPMQLRQLPQLLADSGARDASERLQKALDVVVPRN
ncbi:carboxymuconolactone decarboxylase family protein [Herbaspirillum seropedicae]|nr:carboxymuconolactone decarboxylase family protein [Herbaspirillum sp. alder98]MCA1323779.1 carboxymuconolactone decarboxylase family protein [Herbaspirillum sp. alder98]